MKASDQGRILDWLSDPATHGGCRPVRLDTHISAVFLANGLAWKLKKAVKLPFVDFTTLAARRGACMAEITVNAPWAPELYLGVCSITCESDGSFALDGRGVPVDAVVLMRRFDDGARMDELLRQDCVDRDDITHLARCLWRGWGQEPIYRERGGADALAAMVKDLHASFTPHSPVPFASTRVERLFRAWQSEMLLVAPDLDRRRQQGWVRRCHGDLHLANICRFQGDLTPYDAIEFSDSLAIIDVAYDLAFIGMDLTAYGRLDLAALLMNRCLDMSGDIESCRVMPLFLSLRAGVRAMVMAAMGKGEAGGDYLTLAERMLQRPVARLVAVGGLSGSGKSRLSSRLSPLLGLPGAPVIRSDAIRKRLMGVDPAQKLDSRGYAPDVTARVYAELASMCAQALRLGSPVIADAVFSRPEERRVIEEVARQAGARFDGLWLEAPYGVAALRIEGRIGDASDATPEVLARQQDYELGEIDWSRIATDRPGEQTVAIALERLA